METSHTPAVLLAIVGIVAAFLAGTTVNLRFGQDTKPVEARALGGGIPAAGMPAPKPPITSGWNKVASWKGRGNKQTESFQVVSRQWRVTWATIAGEPGCVFQATVKNEFNTVVGIAASVASGGSDISYLRTEPGRYYLDIGSANCEWTVSVEDMR